MNKCFYYLRHGLWSVAECCFDEKSKLGGQYFWGVAAHPNRNTFSSHIISTPWQQSWKGLALIMKSWEDDPDSVDQSKLQEYELLKNEVDFQYTLSNYSTDNFVQDLFLIYSKLQGPTPFSFNESEVKTFVIKLKKLFQEVLSESPSSAHTLAHHLLGNSFFVSFFEAILKECLEDVVECKQLMTMILSAMFCTDRLRVLNDGSVLLVLGQSEVKNELCLLLLAHEQVTILKRIVACEKLAVTNLKTERLKELLKHGVEPEAWFQRMLLLEKHWTLDLLDVVGRQLDDLQTLKDTANIPNFIWPLLLVYHWTQGPVTENNLLYLIGKCRDSCHDKIIIHICFVLEWYTNFSKWYHKHKTSNNFVDLNDAQLLQKAKEHSVLYLINKTTDLSTIEWRQIREMLQQINSNAPSIWDSMVFESYCIIMKVLKAIIAASYIDQFVSNQKTSIQTITTLNKYFKNLYEDDVTKRLKSARRMIKNVYPLTFRLEVLENVFSLIFLTLDEIKEVGYWKECNERLDARFYLSGRSKSVPIKLTEQNKQPDSPTKSLRNEQDGRALSKSMDNVLALLKNQEKKPNKFKGFLCKKYIIRDLIHLIKDCLEGLEEEAREVKDKDNDVPCSIEVGSQMENRLDKLTESVSEASWRLQLVTDPDFVSEVGVMNFSCGQDPFHNFDNEWIYIYDDLERNSPLKLRKKSGAEKSIDSGTASHSSPDNVTAAGETTVKKRPAPPAIMNQMLSSDTSLVVHCLVNGDVLNADHIIHLMSEQENGETLAGELNFTRTINDLKKKLLLNMSPDSPIRKISSAFPGNSGTSFQSIQQVASHAVNTTAVTNLVELFLSGSTTLPTIQGAAKVSQGTGSMLQCIENSAAVVTIDLAITTSTTYQDFLNLMNIASKHCAELTTRIQSALSSGAYFTKPIGYISFAQTLNLLLKDVNKIEDEQISIYDFVRSDRWSFSQKTLKEKTNFWKELNNFINEFDKNRTDDVFGRGEVGLLARCQKNIKEIQAILEGFIKCFDGSFEFIELGLPNDPNKAINYTKLLNRYLSDLSNLALDNIPPKKELEDLITFHSLLQQSAVDIIDKLIFKYNIEPAILDKRAQQLGFNLSASLVAGCCPQISQSVADYDVKEYVHCERIVLNVQQEKSYLFPEPKNSSKLIESILSELLLAFNNYLQSKDDDATSNILTQSDIEELKQDFKIQSILGQTQDLGRVNLNELKTTNETMAFFINLLNLVTIHCYLSCKLTETNSLFSNNATCREVASKFIGYNVGQLEFVSLADLRNYVLGEEVSSMFSVSKNEFWNKIKLDADSRYAFSIYHISKLSPKLKMFRNDNLNEQLQADIHEYLSKAVQLLDNTLIITDLIDWFYDKVLVNQEPESHSVRSQMSGDYAEIDKLKLLVEFLLDNTNGEINRRLKTCLISNLTIQITQSSEAMQLVLGYDDYENQMVVLPDSIAIPAQQWENRELKEPVIKYLNQHSRVLADIIEKIHENQPNEISVARDVLAEDKFRYVDLLVSAPWGQELAPLFDNNYVLAALNKHPNEEGLWAYFSQCICSKLWKKCCDILFALPDFFLVSHLNLKRFKDLVLFELASTALLTDCPKPWWYCKHITDVSLRTETVLSNLCFWPSDVCLQELTDIYRDYPELTGQWKNKIIEAKDKVKVYSEIVKHCPDLKEKSWFEIYCIGRDCPGLLMQSLVRHQKFDLCLQWTNLPGVLSSIQKFIDAEFIRALLDPLPTDFVLLDRLLKSISKDKFILVCDQVINYLKSLNGIRHVAELVLGSVCSEDEQIEYTRIVVGVYVLSVLNTEDQRRLIHLVRQPILMVEQLLMNTKLEVLDKLLRKLSDSDKHDLVPQHDINQIICKYASKAIDLRLVKAVKSNEAKPSYLLASSPTSTLQQEFVVPNQIPEKTQWTPDNQVSVCMCCCIEVFSMFNRRHHCRRCGRVVCATCSSEKLKVAGYKGVPVRVCSTCFNHHAIPEGDMRCSQSVDTVDGSSITQDCQSWVLFADSTKNITVREEFSYEHSPSVSLCLAIFNLHSDQAVASSLLLDESERLLKLIQGKGNSTNPEIDYTLVIQIIRSLVLGAKVKYGQAGLATGVENCDRLLSQVDLLHLLVKSHCAYLIPSDALSGHALRQLRDRLIEEELWDLAMEVSTKSGLDKNGVWATWGKICLSSGCLDEARSKFVHCLKSNEGRPRPNRNPPLVDEICFILEAGSSVGSRAVKAFDKTANAQEIDQILSSLKLISQGKYTPKADTLKDTLRYEEAVYYLSLYGSHQGLLSFYIKHEDWHACLHHVLEQQLDPDIFLESVLLPSLKMDKIEHLKSELLIVDSTLDAWKKYLSYCCQYLQRMGYLHTLYELQLFMQDNVRAAVTCIKFYHRDAKSYSDLLSRSDYLNKALKHLEEEISYLTKKGKKLSGHSLRLEPKEVNKHISTINRQLEASKFLANCESDGREVLNLLAEDIKPQQEIPTLFSGNRERVFTASLIILAGSNLEEGFGIAYRIIQDYHLKPVCVFADVGKRLATFGRIKDIDQLLTCIKTSGSDETTSICDQVLLACVEKLSQSSEVQNVEKLIKCIVDLDLKIKAYIISRHLKSAYLLAVKHNRLNDIRTIMEEAERLGQASIKNICRKRLGISPANSECSSIPSEHSSIVPDS